MTDTYVVNGITKLGDYDNGNGTRVDQYGRQRVLLTDFVSDAAYQADYEQTTSTVAQSRDTAVNMAGYTQLAMVDATNGNNKWIAYKFNSGSFVGTPGGVRLWLDISGSGNPDELTVGSAFIYSDSAGAPDTVQKTLTPSIYLYAAYTYGLSGVTPIFCDVPTGSGDLIAATNYWLVFNINTNLPSGSSTFTWTAPYHGADTGVLKTSSDGVTWAAQTGHGFYDVYAVGNNCVNVSTDTGTGLTATSETDPAINATSIGGNAVTAASVFGEAIQADSYGAASTARIANHAGGIGVDAASTQGTAVQGAGLVGGVLGQGAAYGVGGQGLVPDAAQLRLVPWVSGTGPPTTLAHVIGDVFCDTNGTIWTCNTAGTPGTWVIIDAGQVVTKTANYTATMKDRSIYMDAAGKTITLPTAAAANKGKRWAITNTNNGGTTTISPTSGTINNAASYSLAAALQSAIVESTGTAYWVISNA